MAKVNCIRNGQLQIVELPALAANAKVQELSQNSVFFIWNDAVLCHTWNDGYGMMRKVGIPAARGRCE